MRLATPRSIPPLVLLVLYVAAPALAQTSTGTISGVVTDASGGVVAGAEVTVTSVATGLARSLIASESGRYAALILSPGMYAVTARSRALQSRAQAALVQAGLTTTVDLTLDVDPVTEIMTVHADDRLRHDHHQVGGWIGRAEIDQQPLNGRNVLELVKLEPGVLNPQRLTGGRVFIAPLGAGLQTIPRIGFTRVTLDGGNFETPGTVGSLLQISPEVVDQIQLSTVNFDVSTGLATSGAVNVVTRSGGNQYRLSAFTMFRDQRWSASPVESSGSNAADPVFHRRQSGASFGGPILPRRAFFFVGYERHDQRDVIGVLPRDPDLSALGGMFESPYSGTLFSGRVDVRVSDRHQTFFRHTHDTNGSDAAPDVPALPSAWFGRPNRAHQTMAAVTSVLSSNFVNDVRASYFRIRTSIIPVTAAACQPPCFGFGAPRVLVSDGGPPLLTLGAGPHLWASGRRMQISDSLVWQRGAHLVRFGFDWERTYHWQATQDSPVEMTLWAPSAVRQRDPSIGLPASLATVEDILRLPLRSFTMSVGSGDVLQRGFEPTRRLDVLRLHAGDQWRVGSRISLNAGVGWSFEPGVLNADLSKPEWLSPLMDSGDLQPPAAHHNLSGGAGFAWNATGDGRTVVRGGAGRYFDSIGRTVALNLFNERILLSPLGTGRLVVSGSNLVWNGRRLNFLQQPTTFTGADLLATIPDLRASLEQSLAPENRDYSLVNLDRTKEGRNLYDASYETPRAVHASIGVEREIRRGIFLSADAVWKGFSNTFINGIDYNRFFSAQGPVIPACTAAQSTDVLAVCSNGSLYFDTTSGRARYVGLLVRAEKRLSRQRQFLVSYAYGSFVGSNGTGAATTENSGGRVFGFNNDDWLENYGPLPTDLRHVLNASGMFSAPGRLDVSFNLSVASRAPFSAYVAGMDFNGDGTMNDLLPGTRVNQFNRSLDRDDLVRLVKDYNASYAGKLTAGGQRAPVVTLPESYAFNDSFFALDLRVGRTFRLRKTFGLMLFGDVFNVLNTRNLTGYSGNLAARSAFGQPTGRVGQAFGSGGPRGGQIGIRVGF